MNKEEILAMKAGKKLNLLIMEKVMGFIVWEEKRGEYTHIVFQNPDDQEPYRKSRNWEKEMDRYKQIEYSEIDNHNHVIQEIKSYSSDISAAWEVINKIQGEWAWDMVMINASQEVDVRIGRCRAASKNVPLAICKAALLAVME